MLTLQRAGQGARHIVIWDDRYSDFLFMLALGHVAGAYAQAGAATFERVFAGIARVYVLEQLCPANRLAGVSSHRSRSPALLNRLVDAQLRGEELRPKP